MLGLTRISLFLFRIFNFIWTFDMTVSQFRFSGLCASALLLLSACGEGYVTEDYFGVPYTMERTAHHGVAYVRAKMAPPAGPVIEPQNEELSEELGPEVPALQGTQVPEEEPVRSAEPLFVQESKK